MYKGINKSNYIYKNQLTKEQKEDFKNGRKKLFVAIDNVIDLIKNDVIFIDGIKKEKLLQTIKSIFYDLKANDFEEVSIYKPPNFNKNKDLHITYLNWVTKELICVKFKDFIVSVMSISDKPELDIILKAIQNELELIEFPEKTKKLIEFPEEIKKGNEMTDKKYIIDLEVARNKFEELLKDTISQKITDNNKSNLIISAIVNHILNDTQNHYVSFSQEDIGKISYAKESQYKKDSNKRIKTTLGKYIKKYYGKLYNIDPSIIDSFEEKFNKRTKIKDVEEMLNEESKNMFNYEENNLNKQMVKGFKDMVAKDMISIFKNRDALLNIMKDIIDREEIDFLEEEVLFLDSIVSYIEKDTNNHYLTISQDNPNMVSYAKDNQNKFNSDKRTKLYLKRYIEKYVLPNILINDSLEEIDVLLEDFESFVIEVIERKNTDKSLKEINTNANNLKSKYDNKYEHFNNELKNNVNDEIKAKDITINNIFIPQKESNNNEIKITFNDKDSLFKEIKNKIKEEYNLKKDRDMLLQAFDKTLQSYTKVDDKKTQYFILRELNDFIELDKNRHYLSLSQEDEGKVSYSKSENNRFNNEKRTKNDFYKYLKKYIKPYLTTNKIDSSFTDLCLKNITMDVMKNVNKLKLTKLVIDKTQQEENKTQQELPNIFKRIQDTIDFKIEDELIKKDTKTTIKTYKTFINGKKIIISKKIYEKNKIILETNYYENGNIKNEILFKDNKFFRRSEYYDNFIIKSISYFKNGNLNDPIKNIPAITYYDKNGIVIEKYFYNEGFKYEKHIYKNSKKTIISYNFNGYILASKDYDLNGNLINDNFLKINNDSTEQQNLDIFDDLYIKDINISALNPKIKINKDEIKINKKPKIENKLKKEISSAGYRVAANQISKGVRRTIITLMKETGMSNTKLKHVEDVLDSEVGLAIISAMMGYSLTYSKYEDERIKNIAKEFRTEGIVTAGNAIIDEAIKYIIPAIKESMQEIPESKFRIEDLKEIKNQEENINLNKKEKLQQVA